MSTKIEWCDEVWNPVTGCSPVSAGCQNCYAARMAQRLKGRCGYPADDPFRVTVHQDKAEMPIKWKEPRRIFVCSMGDLFHHDVFDSDIARVFAAMAEAYWHTFLVLTKRPERMADLVPSLHLLMTKSFVNFRDYTKPVGPWPLPNVWLGVTTENQKSAYQRIPLLLQTPAAVRFVSVEPMLEEINLTGNPEKEIWPWAEALEQGQGIDWVICGAESGQKRRPCDLKWIRSLRDQCQEAGVPFFLKQMEVDGQLVKMPALDGKVWAEFPRRDPRDHLFFCQPSRTRRHEIVSYRHRQGR